MSTWFVAMFAVSVTFANAACIWAAIEAWALLARARLVAEVAPQFKSGTVEAVNICVQVSGATAVPAAAAAATWGDSAFDVGSDGDGSLEAQALAHIPTAARTLNSLLDTIVRSSWRA
jgi:hypothetical protein